MFLLNIIAFVCPSIGTVLLATHVLHISRKSHSVVRHSAFFAPAMAFAAFGYSMSIPFDTDLTRYFEILNQYKSMTFLEITSQKGEFLIVRDMLFWAVSRTNDVHILPFIIGLIIYSITFYICIDAIQKTLRKISTTELLGIVILTIGVIPPYSTIGNVRCVSAYVVFSYAVYRDLVQKKRNIFTLLCYILPLGLHTTTLILLILRIMQGISKKVAKLILPMIFCIPMVIDVMHKYIGQIKHGVLGTYVYDAFNKAYYYIHWKDGGYATQIQSSISNKVQRLYGTFFLVIFLLIITFAHNRNNKEKILNSPMIAYLYSIALVALASLLFITTGAYWRFEAVVVLFAPVYIVRLRECGDKNIDIMLNVLMLSAIPMVMFNIAFQIRNIDAIATFDNFMIFTGLKVIGELLVSYVH